MAFQICLKISKTQIKSLSVALTNAEFEQFTIGKLKEKALSFFPGVNDPERLRVIFHQDELEDDQTFEECNIEQLSVLMIVLRMPGGGDPPQSRGNESFGKVTETVTETMGLLDRLWFGRSSVRSGAEKEKIKERDSASQYKGARSDADLYDFSKKWSDSDASVRLRREEKKGKEKYDQPPAEASSVQPDADLQFLQSLLPALKRMDLRRREFAKAAIQQLVFDIEFNPRFDPLEGMRRTNSKEYLPPNI